jgi:hypothetical protein
MVVVNNEGLNLNFSIGRQEEIFQQDAVLQSLMITFDFALNLVVLRCTTQVLDAFVLQSLCQFARGLAGSIVDD